MQLDDRTAAGDMKFVSRSARHDGARAETQEGASSKNFKLTTTERERRADVAFKKGLTHSEAELLEGFRSFIHLADEKGLSEYDVAKRVLQGAMDAELTLRDMNFVFSKIKKRKYPFRLRFDVLRSLGFSLEEMLREGDEANLALGPEHSLDPRWAAETGLTWEDAERYMQRARAERRRDYVATNSSVMSYDDKQKLAQGYEKLNAGDKAKADEIIAARRRSSTVMDDDDDEEEEAGQDQSAGQPHPVGALRFRLRGRE